ncbi:hypothetical protein ACFC1R_27010 [Kitasatospora sp. NPDC056138]
MVHVDFATQKRTPKRRTADTAT